MSFTADQAFLSKMNRILDLIYWIYPRWNLLCYSSKTKVRVCVNVKLFVY